MVDLLHNLITRSTNDLNTILQKHTVFLPSKEKIETTAITEVLEDPRPEDAPQVKINVYKEWLVIGKNQF